MNTIEIREKNPELIKRLRESVKAYMEWHANEMESSLSYMNWRVQQSDKLAHAFYNNFITQCVVEDIKALQTIIKGE